MAVLNIEEICFFDCIDNLRFSGIAFCGEQFYITSPKSCEIVIFDSCFKKKRCVKTCREYTSICYDENEQCFWALAEKSKNSIFKISDKLKEVDCISVKRAFSALKCVACSQDPSKLLVLIGDEIFEISKLSSETPKSFKKMGGEFPSSLYFDCGELFYSTISEKGGEIRHFSDFGEENSVALPAGYTSLDMTGNCFYKNNSIYILAVKNYCYQRVLRCCLVDTRCSACDNDCLSCDNSQSCCFEPCQENLCCNGSDDTCCDLCCDSCKEDGFDSCSNLCECEDTCFKPCCDCSEDACDNSCCNPCCSPCCCDSCYGPCCNNSCDNIIESVALEQTALSHILNAEGEKLQKILSISNNPKEILKVNKDIRNTISDITHLEYVLYDKLRLAQNMHDDCEFE